MSISALSSRIHIQLFWLHDVSSCVVFMLKCEVYLQVGIAKLMPDKCVFVKSENNIKTSRASVAQLVRARDCQSLGRRFDSG